MRKTEKRKRIINPYTKCCRITNTAERVTNTAERGHVNIGTIGEQNCRQNPENRDCGQPFGEQLYADITKEYCISKAYAFVYSFVEDESTRKDVSLYYSQEGTHKKNRSEAM